MLQKCIFKVYSGLLFPEIIVVFFEILQNNFYYPDYIGLSEDESSSPKKKPLESIVDDAEPTRSAAAALDDLLGGKSKVKESKSRKPTFLEQMMSKGTTRKNASGAFLYSNVLFQYAV